MYTVGLLHPKREEGVNFYQNIVRRDIYSHFELEQHAGTRIYPHRARVIVPGGDEAVCKAQAICAAVEEGGDLSW